MKTGKDIINEQVAREGVINKIQEKFPNIDFPEPVMEPIFYGRRSKEIVANRKLIMDAKTGIQWDVVSDQYSLLYHEELLDNLLQLIPEQFGEPVITVDMWQNSARIKVKALFPELDRYEVAGSPIRPEIRLFSSYDRSTFFGGSWGARELVCSNGLVAYREKAALSFKHAFGKASEIGKIKDKLNAELEQFSEQVGVWNSWAEREFNKLGLDNILYELPFSEKEQERILELPLLNNENRSLNDILKKDKHATLWNINSAATQFVNEIKSKQRVATIEETISSVIHKFNR